MSPNENPSVGIYLLDSLKDRGVDHIFGIPGDYVIRFNKQIEEHSIQLINTTREDTAGYMADAYARMHGLGVVCITYGVGISVVNALAQAYVEGSPLVIISGAAATHESESHPLLHHLINTSSSMNRDTTQLNIFKQVTIGQAVLQNPETAANEINALLDLCIKENKPVYIELPRDMVTKAISPRQKKETSTKISNQDSLQESLKETAAIFAKSEKPLIWVGRDVGAFGLQELVLKFAEKWKIPIASTLLGKSVIDEHHSLAIGVYQGGISRSEVEEYVNNADAVLAIGAIMNDVNTGFFTHAFDRSKRIRANPHEIRIGHHEYKGVVLRDFVEGLEKLELEKPFKAKYPDQGKRLKPFSPSIDTPITTARFFDCIQSHLTHEHIIATDVGDCLFACADLVLHQNSFVASAYFAALGTGAPMAIGAQFGAPDRRVIGIVGDGGFQMSALELSTAIRYHLDPIIIILNNHGYGTERPLLEGSYNDLLDWDYTAITQVLGGGVATCVFTEEECQHALQQAINDRGTLHLIEIELDKLDFSPALQRFKKLAEKKI